jgi:hypothetical protein
LKFETFGGALSDLVSILVLLSSEDMRSIDGSIDKEGALFHFMQKFHTQYSVDFSKMMLEMHNIFSLDVQRRWPQYNSS